MIVIFSGRNDKGQLGHGDTLRKDVPTLIESLQSLVLIDGACGKNHTLLLSGQYRYLMEKYFIESDQH